MAELVVDEKHRVTLPKQLRRSLGIESGSRLEVEQRAGEIVIRPAVPVKRPTEAMWGLSPQAAGRNPKREAREAVAKRKRVGK